MKLAVTDGDVYIIFIQLVDETRESIELRVGEELDKVGAIAWRDVIALEMATDVPKGDGIAVDVEGFYLVRGEAGFLVLMCLLELAEKVL